MLIRRFVPDDLRRLALQDEQQDLRPLLETPSYGVSLATGGAAFTIEHDGAVLGCCGVAEHNTMRAEAWALLSPSAGPHMRAITRASRGFFDQSHYGRIEASVATDFEAGHRWVSLLGFQQEGPERPKFFQDGRSAITYVRLK